LPQYSIGYINLVQFVILAVSSTPAAKIGVISAYNFSKKELRHIYIILMIYIALKMIGVFEWLQIPL